MQKVDILEKRKIYEAVKAKEEKYYAQQAGVVLKRKEKTGLTGSFTASDSPAIVEPGKNTDHPCVWLNSYHKLRRRTSVGSASY